MDDPDEGAVRSNDCHTTVRRRQPAGNPDVKADHLARSARFIPTAFQAVSFQPPLRVNRGWLPEYRRSAHAVTDLKYHVVWVTKYRYKILRGDVAERARDLLRQICVAREVTSIRGAVSPDHIHLLVAVPPQLAPAKLVQFLKGPSRLLQQEFPALRKRYWGQHLWARGYYCVSVGTVDEKTIREYTENQRWDEDVDGFKITEPTEP